MNSLVGYGVSSDSDSDAEAAGDDVNNSTRDGPKSRNFLLETGSASSESDPEDEPEPEPEPEPPRAPARAAPVASPIVARTPLPPPLSSYTPKLPPPPLGAASRSSVFANPFKAQADEKLNALQKHVPLTLQANPSQIGGKRMCVAYRKDGRCRFGIKCKFAHDSDLPTSIIPSEYDPPGADDSEARHQHAQIGGKKICTAYRKDGRCRFGAKCKFSHDTHLQSSVIPSDYDPPRRNDSGPNSNAGVHHSFHHNRGGDDEEETEEQQTKKRRVGLSNTLVPPKRAMKQYAMQKERERVHLS